MIYDVKPDLTHKSRLVCNGFKADPRGASTKVTLIKRVSACILDLIADFQNLKVLQGDIDNTFNQAPTKENIYTKRGSGLGNRASTIAILKHALYHLTTSTEFF